MTLIDQLVYKLTADTSNFDKGVETSETKVTKFSSIATKSAYNSFS